jgi:predicted DNA-binding transcriptional regulator AlpA
MQDTFLTAAQVCQRYGSISDVTLWRWLHNPDVDFPQPIRVGNRKASARRLWKLADLEAWEQAREAASAQEAA